MEELPEIVTVAGRNRLRENQDLQGEYHRMKAPRLSNGRPAYRKLGTDTVIRYWPSADRWLIDRDGLRESDNCNAYSEQMGRAHPGFEDLVWRVWETPHKAHVRDPEMLVTCAPSSVQVIGRASGKENWALNGEYRLVGLHQGRVAYQKEDARHAIRYWAQGDRWLIDLDGLRDVDACNAYADAHGHPHPGSASLAWHVWDSTRGKHLLDSCVQSVVAPAVVEIVGREAPKENVSMNGSYHLYGLHQGRPAYMKADGTGHAVRYWPQESRWLVDLDGLREVDICNAYCEVSESSEAPPSSLDAVWFVWETSRGRHIEDHAVHSVVAPHWVRVSGRDVHKENVSINGDYVFVCIVEGRPAYRKERSNHVIRYWPAEDRWIIDLEAGFDGGDVANAFADAKGAPDPGNSDLIWHVWETKLGVHVTDEDVCTEGLVFKTVDWFAVSERKDRANGADGADAISPSDDEVAKK